MTHSPPRTADPSERPARRNDVSDQGKARAGDVSGEARADTRHEVRVRQDGQEEIFVGEPLQGGMGGANRTSREVSSCSFSRKERNTETVRTDPEASTPGLREPGSALDTRTRPEEAANPPLRTRSPVVREDSGQTANYSGPRGGLGASMQVLQLELAQMQALSSWATGRPVSGRAGSPRRGGESAREVALGSGWGDQTRAEEGLNVQRLENSNRVTEEDEGLQIAFAERIKSNREASSSTPVVTTVGKWEPGSGERRRFSADEDPGEARERPVQVPGRQSLADFLALEAKADRVASREAFLKQRALSAANERRRLTEGKRRPGSGESIPECVEVSEEVSSGEEKGKLERRLSEFTPLRREGDGVSVNVRSEEAQSKSETWHKEDNGREETLEKATHLSKPLKVKGGPETGEGKESTTQNEMRGDLGRRELSGLRGDEKGDLTARLAAEVVALKARLAAKDAGIMRIRRAEREPEPTQLESQRCLAEEQNRVLVKDQEVNAREKLEVERETGTESGWRTERRAEASASKVGRKAEAETSNSDPSPLSENGLLQPKAEAIREEGKRGVARRSSLAWEFVPPESAPAIVSHVEGSDWNTAVDARSAIVTSAEAVASCSATEVLRAVDANGIRTRPRSDETQLREAGKVVSNDRNRALRTIAKPGRHEGRADVIFAPDREVSQDSLCPPTKAAADVTLFHVAHPRAPHVQSNKHVPRPGSVLDGSLNIPDAAFTSLCPILALDVPRADGKAPCSAALYPREPSFSNRGSVTEERATRAAALVLRERESSPGVIVQGLRVPYALPGESGISAARVWEAFQLSRHQTPSGRRHADVIPSHYNRTPAERRAYEQVAMQCARSGDVGMTSAGATGGSHRPPTALSLEEQSILASLQRLDLKLRGLGENRQGRCLEKNVLSSPHRLFENLISSFSAPSEGFGPPWFDFTKHLDDVLVILEFTNPRVNIHEHRKIHD